MWCGVCSCALNVRHAWVSIITFITKCYSADINSWTSLQFYLLLNQAILTQPLSSSQNKQTQTYRSYLFLLQPFNDTLLEEKAKLMHKNAS